MTTAPQAVPLSLWRQARWESHSHKRLPPQRLLKTCIADFELSHFESSSQGPLRQGEEISQPSRRFCKNCWDGEDISQNVEQWKQTVKQRNWSTNNIFAPSTILPLYLQCPAALTLKIYSTKIAAWMRLQKDRNLHNKKFILINIAVWIVIFWLVLTAFLYNNACNNNCYTYANFNA